MSTVPAIGLRIKRLRAKLDLTQTAFAEKIGVKGGVVSAWENGTAPVPYGRVLIICEAYRVNERWLQTGVGEMMMQPRQAPAPARDQALEYFMRILDRTTPEARHEALEFMREVIERYEKLQKEEGEIPSVDFSDPDNLKIYSADADFENEDDDEYDYEYEDEYGDEYDE